MRDIEEVGPERWIEVSEPAGDGHIDITSEDRMKQIRRIAHVAKRFEKMADDIHAIRQQTAPKEDQIRAQYDENEFFYRATYALDNGVNQQFVEEGIALVIWQMTGTGTVRFEESTAPTFALESLIQWPQRFTKCWINCSAQVGQTLTFLILKDKKFWGNLQPIFKTNPTPVTLSSIAQLPTSLTGAGNLKVALQESAITLPVSLTQLPAALTIAGSLKAAIVEALSQLPASLSGSGNLKVDIAEAISLAITNAFLNNLDVALSTRAASIQLPSALTGAGSLKAAIVEALSQLPAALTGAGSLKAAIVEALSQLPTSLSGSGNLKIAIQEWIANQASGFSKQYSVGTAAITLDAYVVPAGASVALIPDTGNSGQIAYTLDGATTPVMGTHAGLKANQGIAVLVQNVNQIKVIASASAQILNVTVD